MEVKQVFELTNQITSEVTGESDLVQEDLSNVVDVGNKLLENEKWVENFTRTLYDRIGRTIFVNRKMESGAPNVLFDSWEYGSILQKVSTDIPEATENETWELEDGVEYSQDIFTKPTVRQKFYNNKITFEIPRSIANIQLKSAFSDATALNAFFSMLETYTRNSLTLKNDGLIMRTLNNFLASTLNDYSGTGVYTGTGNTRAINLLALYNNGKTASEKLPLAGCIYNPQFQRFATFMISTMIDRVATPSKLFNMGGEVKFTPRNLLKICFLSEFYRASDVYLQSDVYHNNLTELPKENLSTVPFWQGSGNAFDFSDTSKISVKTAEGKEVSASGIIGCMWDRDALGISNFREYTTSHYNARAEFTNLWHKVDTGNFNDFNENFIMFYVA